MNRYFVFEGKTLRAAQSTFECAVRYVDENRCLFVVAQALDGRWDFGPYTMERLITSDEHGTFPTHAAAVKALAKEADCSFAGMMA